jgi:dienelactone hydrolase
MQHNDKEASYSAKSILPVTSGLNYVEQKPNVLITFIKFMKLAIPNLTVTGTRRAFGLSVLSCLFFIALPVAAEQVEATLPGGIVATANFHSGLASRPAVLVLHGFLQTHHSPPMSSLASNLASKGYTVLNPTMSLAVNRRSQSMACEAIHTHTMEGEVAEVAYWVNWLNNKGYKHIALIGFSSTGNIDALLSSAPQTLPSIKNVILISMNPLNTDPKVRKKLAEKVRAQPLNKSKELKPFSLGYCKNNFITTERNYLSYAAYDSDKVIELIRQTPVPTEIILGSADTILPANWGAKIKALNAQNRVIIIDKANHFFDDTYEFDLAEAVENILKNIPTR